MCKLYAVVEIENKKNAELFTRAALPIITKTDNHGLGIMRLGERGVHIQRWLDLPAVVRKNKSKVLMKYEKALKHQANEEGNRSNKLYAIAVHGRFATCAKTLANTHPFYRNGTALMHNGIISNAEKYDKPLSTCDSEALLTQYLQHEVRANNIRLTDALKDVSGYYATIVFNDNGIIDIWRDETASLYIAHVKGVGVVIATTKEIITGAARKCKAYITGIDEMLPWTTIRWHNGVNPRIGTFENGKPYQLTHYTSAASVVDDEYKKWWQKQDGTGSIDDVPGYQPREWSKTERWKDYDKGSGAPDVVDASEGQGHNWPEGGDSDEDLEAKFLAHLQKGK